MYTVSYLYTTNPIAHLHRHFDGALYTRTHIYIIRHRKRTIATYCCSYRFASHPTIHKGCCFRYVPVSAQCYGVFFSSIFKNPLHTESQCRMLPFTVYARKNSHITVLMKIEESKNEKKCVFGNMNHSIVKHAQFIPSHITIMYMRRCDTKMPFYTYKCMRI